MIFLTDTKCKILFIYVRFNCKKSGVKMDGKLSQRAIFRSETLNRTEKHGIIFVRKCQAYCLASVPSIHIGSWQRAFSIWNERNQLQSKHQQLRLLRHSAKTMRLPSSPWSLFLLADIDRRVRDALYQGCMYHLFSSALFLTVLS